MLQSQVCKTIALFNRPIITVLSRSETLYGREISFDTVSSPSSFKRFHKQRYSTLRPTILVL